MAHQVEQSIVGFSPKYFLFACSYCLIILMYHLLYNTHASYAFTIMVLQWQCLNLNRRLNTHKKCFVQQSLNMQPVVIQPIIISSH